MPTWSLVTRAALIGETIASTFRLDAGRRLVACAPGTGRKSRCGLERVGKVRGGAEPRKRGDLGDGLVAILKKRLGAREPLPENLGVYRTADLHGKALVEDAARDADRFSDL